MRFWFMLAAALILAGCMHVGIYDTDNQFIHASTSQGVTRSSLDNVYWNKKFWQARRI